MAVEIAINNLTKARVDKKAVQAAIRAVLRAETAGKFNPIVSVAFVGAERMRKLNKKYRSIDAPTDVLSFCEHDVEPSPGGKISRQTYMGEIVINPECVKKMRAPPADP